MTESNPPVSTQAVPATSAEHFPTGLEFAGGMAMAVTNEWVRGFDMARELALIRQSAAQAVPASALPALPEPAAMARWVTEDLREFLQNLIERCGHGDIDEDCEDYDWRHIYVSARAMLAALASPPAPDVRSPCLSNFDVVRIGNEHRVPIHAVRAIEAALGRDMTRTASHTEATEATEGVVPVAWQYRTRMSDGTWSRWWTLNEAPAITCSTQEKRPLYASPPPLAAPAGDRAQLAEECKEQAQVFASAWSLVGGRFDSGNALTDAKDAKAELHALIDRLRDAAPAPAIPEGWVPLRIEFEPGYLEEVAFGPQIMMDRLKKWLDKFYELRLAAAPAQPAPADTGAQDTLDAVDAAKSLGAPASPSGSTLQPSVSAAIPSAACFDNGCNGCDDCIVDA